MSIGRRGDLWVVRVELGKDARGKRRQEYKRFKTRREAEKYETQIKAAKEAGRPGLSRQSFEEYVRERYLPAIATAGLRETTLLNYSGLFERHIFPSLGHVPLKDITTLMLDDLYRDLSKKQMTVPGKTHKTLSPTMVAHVHALINMALGKAVAWRLLTDNPAKLASPPRSSAFRKEAAAWNVDEAVAFLEWSRERGHRLYALWFFLLSTGMRRGEALGMLWSEIDWDEGTITVRRQLLMGDARTGPQLLERTKSKKGLRTVKIEEDLLAVLRRHERQQKLERWAAGPKWVDSGHVFTKRTGEPLRPQSVTDTFTETLCRAMQQGLPVHRITLHGLRHTFVTMNIKAGVHSKIISEMAGHHSAHYTVDTYGHVDVSAQKDAALAIQMLLRSKRSADHERQLPMVAGLAEELPDSM